MIDLGCDIRLQPVSVVIVQDIVISLVCQEEISGIQYDTHLRVYRLHLQSIAYVLTRRTAGEVSNYVTADLQSLGLEFHGTTCIGFKGVIPSLASDSITRTSHYIIFSAEIGTVPHTSSNLVLTAIDIAYLGGIRTLESTALDPPAWSCYGFSHVHFELFTYAIYLMRLIYCVCRFECSRLDIGYIIWTHLVIDRFFCGCVL
ncbi:unnamed protein product [Albugo candida]|uniref:Uncharacterized protein n=1 Tax=Albugo candida TaxID=65357 RepID=A0A024GF43_9STRA|nr:unnamed protein product [Albugo candida]|eukprot:CCI45376.1 unnamed protein product [Albugo candida]